MKKILKKILYIVIVLAFLLFTLGPILWCFIISISPEKEMFSNVREFFPKQPTLQNYFTLLNFDTKESEIFLMGLKNSTKATCITISIGLPIALMAAYALSRLKFRGREVIRVILLVSMVVPVFTTIIPIYDMFSNMGLLDNIFSLSIVYVSSFLPMITWIISNYINTIPKQLDEAALIDGAGFIRIFFSIILPNCYPIIFASILMMFLMTWNQYQIPMILASTIDTKPLSMVVADFTSKDLVQYGITAACGILALLPAVIFALIFKKSFVLGLTSGFLKE